MHPGGRYSSILAPFFNIQFALFNFQFSMPFPFTLRLTSLPIRRASHSTSALVQNMRIDHRRPDIFVP